MVGCSGTFWRWLCIIFATSAYKLLLLVKQTSTCLIDQCSHFNSFLLLSFGSWTLLFPSSYPYFQVTTLAQVVGTLLCLHAGTKISSKAHNIVAVACRWHALATCKPFQASWRFSAGTLSRSASQGSLTSTFSDSDLCTWDGLQLPARSQLASVPSYNERQSFGKS